MKQRQLTNWDAAKIWFFPSAGVAILLFILWQFSIIEPFSLKPPVTQTVGRTSYGRLRKTVAAISLSHRAL